MMVRRCACDRWSLSWAYSYVRRKKLTGERFSYVGRSDTFILCWIFIYGIKNVVSTRKYYRCLWTMRLGFSCWSFNRVRSINVSSLSQLYDYVELAILHCFNVAHNYFGCFFCLLSTIDYTLVSNSTLLLDGWIATDWTNAFWTDGNLNSNKKGH